MKSKFCNSGDELLTHTHTHTHTQCGVCVCVCVCVWERERESEREWERERGVIARKMNERCYAIFLELSLFQRQKIISRAEFNAFK